MKQLVLKILKIYQSFGFLQSNVCRFKPTCSRYAYQAIEKYGVLKGSIMGIKRVLKCHPGNPGGYDPVK